MSFVLIDRLILLDDSQVVAEKTFKLNDPVFEDHFPGGGIVPGTLLLEGLAQSCGWWVSWKNQGLSKSVLLLAEGVQFRHFVKPEEKVFFEGQLLQAGEGRARFQTRALVAGKLVAKAELSFALFKLDDLSGPFRAEALTCWMEEKFLSLGGPAAVKGNS